jgi:hypothetical protein
MLLINALCHAPSRGVLTLALPIGSLSFMARSGFQPIEPVILNIKQTSSSSRHYFPATSAHEPS